MKLLSGATCLVLLLLLSSCNKKVSDRFIDDHKDYSKVTTVSIPGWLVRTSLNQIEDFSREDDLAVYQKLIAYLDGIRFMISNESKSVTSQDINLLNKNLALEEGSEQYASIKHAEGLFNVWILEKKGEIKSITIITSNDNKFGIARINCHLPIDLFKSSNFSFNHLDHLTKKDTKI